MPRSYLYSALSVVILAVGGFAYTLAVGNEPLLGLDLQGGVSVVLQPTEEASDEALDQTLEIIRNRVDGLGVAEPEISRQGETIVVDLPGVEQQQRALELVGQTAELRFRPVILDPSLMAGITASGGLTPELDPDAVESDETEPDEAELDETGDVDGEPEGDVVNESEVDPGTEGSDEESMGPIRRRQNDTDDEPAESESEAPSDELPAIEGAPSEELSGPLAEALEVCSSGEVTTPEGDNPTDYVVLEAQAAPGEPSGLYCLGPVFESTSGQLLTGQMLEGADVSLDTFNGWAVNPVFRGGADGIDIFNEAAALCSQPTIGANGDICPAIGIDSQTGQPRGALAIVLDGEVISAPLINASSFVRDQIVISGSFEEEGARNLALALRFGALPVELEPQQTRTVSATIGEDVLRSGVIAGLVGLVFVALYLLLYYRLAGLVAIGGLVLSGLMLWTIIGYLGDRYGLAISLAGIVGLIVSIGVSADSNIVYFENVKDVAGKGRRVGTAVERAYRSAISTIVKADVVSLIAAVLLYVLTVGAVKGFALYLGIATLLDLVVSYLFMRPALAWIANRPAVRANPRLVGMPEGSA